VTANSVALYALALNLMPTYNYLGVGISHGAELWLRMELASNTHEPDRRGPSVAGASSDRDCSCWQLVLFLMPSPAVLPPKPLLLPNLSVPSFRSTSPPDWVLRSLFRSRTESGLDGTRRLLGLCESEKVVLACEFVGDTSLLPVV